MITSNSDIHLLQYIPHQYKETKHYAIFLPQKARSIREKIVIGECDPHNHAGLPSIHAEHAALIKLLKLKNRPRYMDLLVLRFSKGGKLGASRPCLNCLNKLEYISLKHNIKICSVYYSTNDGKIDCEYLKDMRESPKTYISGGHRASSTWRRNRKY